jgi:hypothetical protein
LRNPRHLAREQTFDRLVAGLVNDRDFVARGDEFAEIRFDRVMRHAREGHAFRPAHIARRQHDVAHFGHDARVVVKRFVKIAEAKQHQRAGETFFDAEVLLTDGSHRQVSPMRFIQIFCASSYASSGGVCASSGGGKT